MIDTFINSFSKIRSPAEIGILLTLLRGCEFDGLAPHQLVTVDNGKSKTDGKEPL
jgi:hypothetical protein